MYQNPDFKDKVYPEMSTVKDYFNKADAEPDNRDVRPLISLLTRMTQMSPRLKGHMITRQTALSSYDFKLIGEIPDETVLLQRLRPGINSIIRSHTDTPLFGNTLFSIVPSLDPVLNAQVLKLTRKSPIEYMQYKDNTFVLIDDNNLLSTTIPYGDPMIVDWLGETDGESQIGGILRSVVYHELLRSLNIQEWSNLNIRLKGILLGTINSTEFVTGMNILNVNEAEIRQELTNAEDLLRKAGENTYGMLNSGIGINLAKIADASAGNSYQSFKKELEADIAIAILGQANTSELPNSGGSRAALQVLNMIRQDIHYSDMIRVKDLVNRFLLIDHKINFDTNALTCPYEFDWVFDENIDYEANARILEILTRAGLDLEIERPELYRITGLPMPEKGAKDLIKISAPATGGF